MLLVCAIVIVLAASGVKVEAASAKTKALNAYKKFLAEKEIPWDKNFKIPASDCKFAIAYVDNDKIPELILNTNAVPHMAGYGRIFTYKNGKVKRVGPVEMDANKFSYYKKTGVFISCYVQGGVTYSYRKLTKGKIVHKVQKGEDAFGKKEYLDSNSKQISKSTFDKTVKKLVGSKKKTSAKFYKNTASNRKKHCK